MGVKGRAIFAILSIFVFLFSLWLYGSLDGHWQYCVNIYTQKDQSLSFNRSNSSEIGGVSPLRVCPGQKFQVSNLLKHLLAAQLSSDDVLLEPYLASWDELIKFLEALGPMVALISQEIEAKTSVIRQLAQEEAENEQRNFTVPEKELTAPEIKSTIQEGSTGSAYVSVRSMIASEMARGLVDFEKTTASGCRTLLRLHRALLWLQRFLSSLAEDGVRSPAALCKEAYRATLSHHHPWLVRKVAELAFVAMPERAFFYQLVCGRTRAEAALVLDRVVEAIRVVYDRTQAALEENHMLELP